MPDSTPISSKGKSLYGYKSLIVLFMLFMAISSDMFTYSVIGKISDQATLGCATTTWGMMIKGIVLVVLFAISNYLVVEEYI